MESVFWTSACLIAYVYLGYPLLLAIWARVPPRPVGKRRLDSWPAISIIVAARMKRRGFRCASRT